MQPEKINKMLSHVALHHHMKTFVHTLCHKNGSLFGIPINNHGSLHPYILPINSSCWAVNGSFRQSISEMDTTTTFGSVLAFTTLCFTNSSFITMFWVLLTLFQLFLRIFPTFPSKTLYSFNSLLLRSPASSSRNQSDTSLI